MPMFLRNLKMYNRKKLTKKKKLIIIIKSGMIKND